MPSAEGISASLVCNGTPLTEFQEESSDPLTVFCESNPEQTFSVLVAGRMPLFDLLIKLVIDGVPVETYALRHGPGEKADCSFCGIYLAHDPTKIMPFKFSNIQLTEEDDSHPEEIVKNLGTVAVELYKCQLGGFITLPTYTPPQLASKDKFSERNKKSSMIPHTITLCETITASTKQSQNYCKTRWVDSAPYQRFEWKYRSRKMLVTAGIIPDPVSSPVLNTTSPATQTNGEFRGHGKKPEVKAESKPSISGPSITNTGTHSVGKSRISQNGSEKLVAIDVGNDDDDAVVLQPRMIVSSIDNPIIIDSDSDGEPAVTTGMSANNPRNNVDKKLATGKRAADGSVEDGNSSKRSKASVINPEDTGSSFTSSVTLKFETEATLDDKIETQIIDLT